MEIIKLGSIYANGHTYIPRFRRDGNENISLGDTVPGKELQWIQYKGKLIANRCACINASWKQLDKIGYTFAWPVLIDGNCYLCRSLKVGAEEGEPNEWDDVLRFCGYEDSLWHWRDIEFWGQEAPADSCEVRVVRGFYSATYFSAKRSTMLSTLIGFRPVLEPLPALDWSGISAGLRLIVYRKDGSIAEGTLSSLDDYDLWLSNVVWNHRDGRKPKTTKKTSLISKDDVVWGALKE